MELASTSLDLPEDGLGVIARLLVAPMSRRTGVGRHLLDAASTEARELGLWPVLDVLTRYEGANAFYDRCGWTRVGDVMVTLRDDTRFEEAVYVAPDLHRGG
ncbi:MAG: putative GCN5-related N-acetyltransferase [Acidimicrobiaceae bacterium]|nr:putative GCN5-related N-acetyltransferase [Acidimicrobiaceae bacterium]